MVLNIFQIIIAAVLIAAILLQSQGTGLGTAFGGGGEFYRSKRSMEKVLVWATVSLAVLFGSLSVLLLVR